MRLSYLPLIELVILMHLDGLLFCDFYEFTIVVTLFKAYWETCLLY